MNRRFLLLLVSVTLVGHQPLWGALKPEEVAVWKAATIGLEGATDSVGPIESSKRWTDAVRRLQNKEISQKEFDEFSKAHLEMRLKRYRSRGTAIYVSDSTNRYLVTARHVLFDTVVANDSLRAEMAWAERIRAKNNGAPSVNTFSPENSAREHANRAIYQTVFVVPRIGEFQTNDFVAMTVLAAGSPALYAYEYSSPEVDLAVLSLTSESNANGRAVVDYLDRYGRKPIPLSLISTELPSEGEDVATIGFPDTVSVIGHYVPDPWKPSVVSLPAFSFGHVSMVHRELPYFWCDLTVYPGNSGGPVIAGGKLVGIVSGQAVVPLDQAPAVTQRVPFACIRLSSHVLNLIKIQAEKDRNRSSYRRSLLQRSAP